MAIMKCDCTDKTGYEDKKYGKGMRVHNPMKNSGWRCTTCLKEKQAGEAKKK